MYRQVLYLLLQAWADCTTAMLLLHAAASSDADLQEVACNPVLLDHHSLLRSVQETAKPQEGGELMMMGSLSADLAGMLSNPHQQQLAACTPAAGLCAVPGQLAAVLSSSQREVPNTASTEAAAGIAAQQPNNKQPCMATDVNSVLAGYAAAALQILACILSLVHLCLCGFHWIKQCKEYGHTGAPFKHLKMSGAR